MDAIRGLCGIDVCACRSEQKVCAADVEMAEYSITAVPFVSPTPVFGDKIISPELN